MMKLVKHDNKPQKFFYNVGAKAVGSEVTGVLTAEAVRRKGAKRIAKIGFGIGLTAMLANPATKLITAQAEKAFPPEMTAPLPGEAHREYTVKAGDTPTEIAKKYMPKDSNLRPMSDVISLETKGEMKPGMHIHIPNKR